MVPLIIVDKNAKKLSFFIETNICGQQRKIKKIIMKKAIKMCGNNLFAKFK